MAAYAARELATRLTDLGHVLVPREDGNGFEIGGVDQAVMDAFSSRRAQITPEVARMAEEYRQRYGADRPAGRCGPWPRRPAGDAQGQEPGPLGPERAA